MTSIKNTFLSIVTILSTIATSGFFYVGPPFNKSELFDSLSEDTPVVVGITHVILKEGSEMNDAFWDSTFDVEEALPSHDGYLGHKIRKKLFSDDGWTMTLWKNEESLNQFVRGRAHGKAMASGLPAVESARFVRLELPRSELPLSWGDAEIIMNDKGRSLY